MRRSTRLTHKIRNWDLVDERAIEEIEKLNLISQKCVAAALVRFLLTKAEVLDDKLGRMPAETALLQLHRAGTVFLLDKPGCYRDTDICLAKNRDGKVVYQAPAPQKIKKLMRDFFQQLAILWTTGDALDVAAYAVWRLGWIHPFRDGNGRTARLFAYVCLCVKLGDSLPDKLTLVDQICSDQTRWVKFLLAANRSFERGKLDLSAVKLYLDGLLLRQIQSAEEYLAKIKNFPMKHRDVQ